MAEILVLYYSRGGSVAKLARQVARGVEEVPGMQARLRCVPPVAPLTRVASPPEPDDGALDVVHVAWLPRWRLFRLFPHLIKGHHLQRREVTHQRVARLEVSAPELLVYADGERVGSGPCSFWVTPEALTMLVPA